MTKGLRKVLLVEGNDDKHVVLNIWKKLNTNPPPFEIIDSKGIEKLLNLIEIELAIEGIEAVGIIVDTNDDAHKRWKQLSNRIHRSSQIQIPDEPVPQGTIVAEKPRVGVWMMPDNKSLGEIESFIHQMIPNDDKIWPRSERYVAEIPIADRKFKPHKELKSIIHAWMAVRETPRPVGTAIGAGDLNLDTPLVTTFNQWLNNLFLE